MKHKYNVGDKVVYIGWDKDSRSHIISNIEILKIVLDDYYETDYRSDRCCEYIIGAYLYTPKEAIEFITNYINKTGE